MSRSFKLKTSSVQVADMEIEIKQLRETIQDYNQEIQEYKVKEKKLNELQAKVSQKSVSRERELDHGRNALQVDAYDKNIDETLNEKIRDVSDRMLEEYNEKLANMEDEKAAVTRKSEDLDARLRTAQKQLKEAQAELFEVNSNVLQD